MKKLAIILILVQLSILTYAQEYDKYFTPDRLRVDLVFAGAWHKKKNISQLQRLCDQRKEVISATH